METLFQIALVAFGSALGGVARWATQVWFGRLTGPAFPWGTLFINVTGSMFLGWFATIIGHRCSESTAEKLRLLVAIGFTGAFTTFSTFEFEANQLLATHQMVAAAAYVAGSVFLGLVALRLGIALAA